MSKSHWVRVIALAVLLTLAAAPQAVWASAPLQGGVPAKSSLVALAQQLIDLLIFFAGLVLALGVAGSFAAAQIGTAIGNPRAVSQAWMRAVGTLAAFLSVLATIPVANVVIATLAQGASSIGASGALGTLANDAYGWIVFLASLVLAVSLATILLREQLAMAAGAPRAISDAWARLVALVAGFVLILAAPQIASLLRALFGL